MAKLEIPPIEIVPINDMKEAAALAEQLNCLISNYDKVLTSYEQAKFTNNEQIIESVKTVLISIEKAIDAICFRFTEKAAIAKFKGNTTQHL